MNKFAIYLDAYATELAKLTASLDALHRDLCEMRDELRDRCGDERQEPLPLRRAA
jgi:hypothetical protein